MTGGQSFGIGTARVVTGSGTGHHAPELNAIHCGASFESAFPRPRIFRHDGDRERSHVLAWAAIPASGMMGFGYLPWWFVHRDARCGNDALVGLLAAGRWIRRMHGSVRCWRSWPD